MFKRILIATDFSKGSLAALRSGLALARKCLAEVIAVHSITPFEIHFDSPQPLAMQESGWEREVEKQFEDFFPQNIYPNSRKEILVGRSAAEEILKTARKKECDLIVIGSHGHGLIARSLLGSVAQSITRNSEIPVLTVRDVEQSTKKYQSDERVLAPTDFSDTSLKALDLAVRFANFLKADLHLMHVVEWPAVALASAMMPGYPIIDVPHAQPEKELIDHAMKEFLFKKDLIGNSKTETRMGDPAHEIGEYAKQESIDYIVMGSHGRKGLERVLLGSVTSSVIARSRTPVLTISDPS
jgi:nucleotide-binding universal stress UspA family protein